MNSQGSHMRTSRHVDQLDASQLRDKCVSIWDPRASDLNLQFPVRGSVGTDTLEPINLLKTLVQVSSHLQYKC